MPTVSFRLSDADIKDLEKVETKRGIARSRVLRDLVVAEADRVDDRKSAPRVASDVELLELLTERARAGNVTACRLLLERPWDRGKREEIAKSDPFSELDELSVRRVAKG